MQFRPGGAQRKKPLEARYPPHGLDQRQKPQANREALRRGQPMARIHRFRPAGGIGIGQEQFHRLPIRAAKHQPARAAPDLRPCGTARRFPGAQQIARGDGRRFLGREGDGVGQRPIRGRDDPDRARHAPPFWTGWARRARYEVRDPA